MAAKTTATTTTPPVKRNLDDEQLKGVVRELLAEGITTVNAMSKALRGTPRGTNTKRLSRAFMAVKEEQAKAAPKPRTPRAPRKLKVVTEG